MKETDDNKPSDINPQEAESPPEESVPDDGHYIFVAYFRHPKSGKIVRRPNGRPFRIKVTPGRARRTRREVPPK